MPAEVTAESARVAERVANAIIADIQAGHIGVGDAIPAERDLCERHNVSRPTVREALLIVQQRGYASLTSTRRPRAARPNFATLFKTASGQLGDILSDAESVAYLEQVRHYIEAGVLRQVARNISPVQIARLHTALEACREAIGDHEAFKQADIAFHRTLVALAGNPVILALHTTFVGAMFEHRPADDKRHAHHQTVTDEHAAIFEALANGNGDEAAAVLERHLARAYRSYLTASPGPAPAGADVSSAGQKSQGR